MEAMTTPRAKTAQPWTEDETTAFLTATKDDRMAAAWALFLARGPRRGELAGLRWENVDLDQTDEDGDPSGSIAIVEALVVVNGQAIPSDPKTDRGNRSVPLDEHLVAALKSHKAKQAEEKLKAGEGYAEQVYVFADKLGEPYHPETLSGWFEDATKAAGLRRIRLHDCRHAAATHMLMDGVPVNVVAAILGDDPTTVLRVYGHVMPGMAHKAGKAHSAKLFAV
jgi:integrase